MSDTWYSPSRHCQLLCPYRAECTGNPWLSFRGATATQFLEWLTPSSLSTLAPYSSTLSVFLNEHGGIIDDTVVTKHASDAFYVVTNAGRRAEDLAWFEARLAEWNASERARDGPVEHEVLDGWGLLALQGVSNVRFRGRLC
jgi:aminomethyltransferase